MAESIMHPYLANMQTAKELVRSRPKLAHVKNWSFLLLVSKDQLCWVKIRIKHGQIQDEMNGTI